MNLVSLGDVTGPKVSPRPGSTIPIRSPNKNTASAMYAKPSMKLQGSVGNNSVGSVHGHVHGHGQGQKGSGKKKNKKKGKKKKNAIKKVLGSVFN